MLLQVLEMRDHLLACELDLDALKSRPGHAPVLGVLHEVLQTLAADIAQLADKLLYGRAPPPVASTTPSSSQSSAIIACSRSRKPGSPSLSKIHGILAPVRNSISLSESLNGRRSSLASNRPMVLFPAPIGPTSIKFRTESTTHSNRLVTHDTRSQEDQQLGFFLRNHITPEKAAKIRHIAKKWHLIYNLALSI